MDLGSNYLRYVRYNIVDDFMNRENSSCINADTCSLSPQFCARVNHSHLLCVVVFGVTNAKILEKYLSSTGLRLTILFRILSRQFATFIKESRVKSSTALRRE